MRKEQWAKSSNGPDWTDVLMMVSAMENIHECRVVLTVTAATRGHNGGASVGLTAHWERLPGTEMFKTLTVEMYFPNATAQTMEGTVYHLAWQLDYKISQAYEQLKLQE